MGGGCKQRTLHLAVDPDKVALVSADVEQPRGRYCQQERRLAADKCLPSKRTCHHEWCLV